MLEVRKVSKTYEVGDFKQKALDNVNIKFRRNEFVSILGPSGSGKTTLLNIIGGLDQYTTGDLIINGKSTKKYKDRDWDTYRNHKVGFVFQTYNLIPHQSALRNVELALTLSGVSKRERIRRAKAILKKVGLEDHMYKRPNQMSGGQMQRVAIARALINDPDILLADEPTGALDSETSLQIMELLEGIASDRLVIMVTHNPELAKEYSTRIIKLKDGKITDDSNPVNDKEEEEELGKDKKTHMSFTTALSLSLNNLMTKKGRTFLTAFAGSIGIIGIALILSLSNGVNKYIKGVEEDTLASYPLVIEKASIDTSSLFIRMMDDNVKENDGKKVYTNSIMTDILESVSKGVTTNDMVSFKKHLEKNNSKIKDYVTDIKYLYNIDLNLYKADYKEEIVQVNPSTVMNNLRIPGTEGVNNNAFSTMGMSEMNSWVELTGNESFLKTQYDLVAGKWPKKYNEVVLVMDQNNNVSDYALYSLGLLNQEDLTKFMSAMYKGEEYKVKTRDFEYDEIVGLKFKLLLNTDYYEKQSNVWIDKRNDEDYMRKQLSKAEDIEVVGIIKVNEDSTMATTGTIGYLHSLTEYTINRINNSDIAKEQKANPKKNVFTGLEFSDEKFSMDNLTKEEKMYLASLSKEELAALITAYSETSTYESNLAKLGIIDLNNPDMINIYPVDFESKDAIISFINDYNKGKTDEDKLTYTDVVGALMKSVTNIINTISYVLIAFVAISLVVSSIMIGIITYISVLERTKEIGILRAMGASKKDVSRVFKAETFIEGTFSGVLGILITLLLNIPINIIVEHLTGIAHLTKLPVVGAIILIVISMLLTIIAGLIPAKIASKKDPVEALRSE
ncbi:MAG: ABC transporter ATP-binding protein/permease [Bacilli bacterium]|nr:ABC transporter ATP-binding protein/permease [Bacilli bacterium]